MAGQSDDCRSGDRQPEAGNEHPETFACARFRGSWNRLARNSGDGGARGFAFTKKFERENEERGHSHDRFRSSELKKFEIVHRWRKRIDSTAGRTRSKISLG